MCVYSGRADYPRVLQRLADLPFIPTERFRLQVRAAGVASLHPAGAEHTAMLQQMLEGMAV